MIKKLLLTPEPTFNNMRLLDMLVFLVVFCAITLPISFIWHSQWAFAGFLVALLPTRWVHLHVPDYHEEP